MKVILTQDVAKIGRRFQVVDVPDGYALNKLIPKRLAEPATPANVKRIEAMAKKHAADEAGTVKAFAEALAKLKDASVAITAEANAEGKLFQALKTDAVVAAAASAGAVLEAGWIHFATPIKTTGEHTVLLSHGEEQGEFHINVVSK